VDFTFVKNPTPTLGRAQDQYPDYFDQALLINVPLVFHAARISRGRRRHSWPTAITHRP
jgi:hypothetical protein